MKKILFSTLALVAVAFGFVSCGDDDDNTRTDASKLVNGKYELIEMKTADESAPLTAEAGAITIEVSKYDQDNTQANKMSITGTAKNSKTSKDVNINISDVLMQTSKANADYLMIYVTSPAMATARVNGDIITCQIKLAAGGKMSAAGKIYNLIARKKALE